MVANYPNAQVFYPSNPVGIDLAIFNIQQNFGRQLDWLEKVFGRCTKQRGDVAKNDLNRRIDLVFPEVYQANDEPMSAMPNDNFKSYCFFNITDPSTILDYNFIDPQNMIERNMSIIFWVNLKKIDANQSGRFNEKLILSVIQALSRNPEFIPEQIFEEYNKVFDDFTIGEQYKQFMRLPFTAFRISGKLTYATMQENVC